MQNQDKSTRQPIPVAVTPSGVKTPVITVPQIDPFARQASVHDELEHQPLQMSQDLQTGGNVDDDETDSPWVVRWNVFFSIFLAQLTVG